MEIINITEFRKHLPAYLKRAHAGEQFRVTSRGRVVARIVPEEDPGAAARKRLFALRGKGLISDVESPVEDLEWTGDADNL